MSKRVFLIVLDSFGIGELPDSAKYGDEGSNTLGACASTGKLNVPNMKELGLFNIDGITCGEKSQTPQGSFARMTEASAGKDTTIGHWEIAGVISPKPLPTYPNGFPEELVTKLEKRWGRKLLCNSTYSGTKVIKDYGREHLEGGGLIVYTSADSVMQIAAHESIVSPEQLYNYCQVARETLVGEHSLGRVIARPFEGEYPNYKRTANRRDFSLEPPKPTMLDEIKRNGMRTIGIGKIYDIFAGKGVDQKIKTVNNDDGMEKTIELAKKDFEGLCFVNLVDFDMLYGHRNDVDGYTNALNKFDEQLGEFMKELKQDDVVILTADHGCDPIIPSTDHSREYTPMVIFGDKIKKGINIGTRKTFADIGATVEEYLGVNSDIDGESFASQVIL